MIQAPVPKLISFEAYANETTRPMVSLRQAGIELPDDAKIRSEEFKAFEFLYYSTFADERPANLDQRSRARIHAGLGDLATKINKALAIRRAFSNPI
jgi:hypothetical protein